MVAGEGWSAGVIGIEFGKVSKIRGMARVR